MAELPGGSNSADVLYKMAHGGGINPPVFAQVMEQGPPHAKTYTWSCSFFEGKYNSVGQGRSKKEARNSAAKNLITQLDLSKLPSKPRRPGNEFKRKMIGMQIQNVRESGEAGDTGEAAQMAKMRKGNNNNIMGTMPMVPMAMQQSDRKTSHIKLDIESQIQHFQQALMHKDNHVQVQACDGAVWTCAIHIASKSVRDMVQDGGCCCHEPVIFLPDTDKMTVALLDSILMNGLAEINLHEGGNLQRTYEKLLRLAQDLGLELFHLDVMLVTKKEPEDYTNNNKVFEVGTIEDDEANEDCRDASSEITNRYEEGGESNVSSNDSSLIGHSPKVRSNSPLSKDQVIDDLLSIENDDGDTSSFEDKRRVTRI